MVAVPPATPVTTPVIGSTVPTAVLLQLHVPPDDGLSRFIVLVQIGELPVIVPGAAVTATITF